MQRPNLMQKGCTKATHRILEFKIEYGDNIYKKKWQMLKPKTKTKSKAWKRELNKSKINKSIKNKCQWSRSK